MNQFQSQIDQQGWGMPAAQAHADERSDFIRNTYVHLFLAMAAFVVIECCLFVFIGSEPISEFFLSIPAAGLILMIGFMAVSWVANAWARSNTSKGLQYAGLSLYVVTEALVFAPLLAIAATYSDPSVIPTAGVLTLVAFGSLTAIVFLTGADFSPLGRYLFWGTILTIGVAFCGIFFGFELGVFFAAAMVALASGYILYETSNIIYHYRTDQYVAASLGLFASVALMLWYMIQLLMSFAGDD
ncbi:MAG: Bax inhibitor-1 family protein [Pirellulaceae bacterium]|nr:Bax inhibitor-1 family protein [Pirellulaceae bacterium]